MTNRKPSPTHFDCEHCDSRDASVFASLAGPQLAVLSDNKACRVYHKGDMIFYVDMIAELKPSSIKDMGPVMKAVIAKSGGAADNKIVSEIIRSKLS